MQVIVQIKQQTNVLPKSDRCVHVLPLDINRRKITIVIWSAPRYCDKCPWALHSAKLDIGIIGLPTAGQPIVPTETPLASWSQTLRQALAATNGATTSIEVVAVEIPRGKAWELLCATCRKCALSCSRNLDVE